MQASQLLSGVRPNPAWQASHFPHCKSHWSHESTWHFVHCMLPWRPKPALQWPASQWSGPDLLQFPQCIEHGAQTPVGVKLNPWLQCSGSHFPGPNRLHLEQCAAQGKHSCIMLLALPLFQSVCPERHSSHSRKRTEHLLQPSIWQGLQPSPPSASPKDAGHSLHGSLGVDGSGPDVTILESALQLWQCWPAQGKHVPSAERPFPGRQPLRSQRPGPAVSQRPQPEVQGKQVLMLMSWMDATRPALGGLLTCSVNPCSHIVQALCALHLWQYNGQCFRSMTEDITGEGLNAPVKGFLATT